MTGWTKIKGAARYSGISERSFRKWMQQGLRYVRMNTGMILIRYRWVDEYLEKFEVTGNEIDEITEEICKEIL